MKHITRLIAFVLVASWVVGADAADKDSDSKRPISASEVKSVVFPKVFARSAHSLKEALDQFRRSTKSMVAVETTPKESKLWTRKARFESLSMTTKEFGEALHAYKVTMIRDGDIFVIRSEGAMKMKKNPLDATIGGFKFEGTQTQFLGAILSRFSLGALSTMPARGTNEKQKFKFAVDKKLSLRSVLSRYAEASGQEWTAYLLPPPIKKTPVVDSKGNAVRQFPAATLSLSFYPVVPQLPLAVPDQK